MTIQEWTLLSLAIRCMAWFPPVFTVVHSTFVLVRSRRLRLHWHTNGHVIRDFWLFQTIWADLIWSIVVSAGVTYIHWVVA